MTRACALNRSERRSNEPIPEIVSDILGVTKNQSEMVDDLTSFNLHNVSGGHQRRSSVVPFTD